ncbi:MAG: hypothetical protein U1G07_24100 [Verrucomicrobiota bacterium]
MQSDLRAPRSPGPTVCWKRWFAKTLLFTVTVFVVLNPNAKRALLQVHHTLRPDALIQTNFPALPLINAEIDRLVAAHHRKMSEARVVSKWVLRKIRYVSDYENWWNLEYWPSADEVWQRGQEDCDGRAILTASILRSRGFRSAELAVGLDHMWVRVDENEKDHSKPNRYVSLLSPAPDLSVEIKEGARVSGVVRLATALLHPTALRATSTHLFADVPPLRKVVLFLVLLVLCYHPCRHRTGLLIVTAVGLAGVCLLATWQPEDGQFAEGAVGALLLLASISAAWFMDRLVRCASPLTPAGGNLQVSSWQ